MKHSKDMKMSNSERNKDQLISDLLECTKSQEDKIVAARIFAQKDDQKIANAIRNLMADKYPPALVRSFVHP